MLFIHTHICNISVTTEPNGRMQVWSKISAASHDIETVLVNGRSLRELSML